jgi:hypothetical protein
MAAYGTIQELKNAINASIYGNDAGLLTAEALQERLHDIIDTLDALGGSGGGDISALESTNGLAQIYAGDDKVATEAWVGGQAFIPAAEKGANSGVAQLDSGGKVPATQLPSYVDDVLEYANLSAFPGSGETGKIYVALDTNLTYRWSGSVYVNISASAAAASSVVMANFSILQESGKLVFKYGSTVIASLSSAGYLKVKDEWEGFVAAP